MLTLTVTKTDTDTGVDTCVTTAGGPDEAVLVCTPGAGATWSLSAPAGSHVWARFGALGPALLFLPEGRFDFPVPAGEAAKGYAPGIFDGPRLCLQARIAAREEIAPYRDLALNPLDHRTSRAFPHASATVETRGEACFAARSAIDGEIANDNHGVWPYTSWGIAGDPQAALTIDFGREVVLDRISLTLRADFPHDSWWEAADVSFDDGSTEHLRLSRSARRQDHPIAPRRCSRLVLHHLVRAKDPSPFPALTRIQAFGMEGRDV